VHRQKLIQNLIKLEKLFSRETAQIVFLRIIKERNPFHQTCQCPPVVDTNMFLIELEGFFRPGRNSLGNMIFGR